MPDPSQISGIGEFSVGEKSPAGDTTFLAKNGRAFLAVHPSTIEIRTDSELAKTLTEKYESVMQSRYFGHGGIEIVLSGQLTDPEIADLIRLSYNLTSEIES